MLDNLAARLWIKTPESFKRSLRYYELPGTEGTMAGTKVTVFNNGPLRLEGDFEIVDQEGKAFGLGGRAAITVCRCGQSGNAPFCDGTHKRQNFTSAVCARILPPPPKS